MFKDAFISVLGKSSDTTTIDWELVCTELEYKVDTSFQQRLTSLKL